MKAKLLIFILFFTFTLQLFADNRNLLQNNTTREQLATALSKNTEWVSYPAYADRAAWAALPEVIRTEIITKGEKALGFDWAVVKATDYLEFTRSGNRKIMEDPENARLNTLQNLALAELMEGKGRFIDAIINGVWAMCEQSTWVHSAHLPVQKGGAGLPNPDDTIIDLGSGRIGALMAWIHYYFAPEFDKVSPHVAERIRREINNRILIPYYTRNDMWWMGFNSSFVNNWNVWVNYNVLQCILLMETDPVKRADNVYKVMTSVDRFLDYYKDDGGCDEGPSYWGHAGGKLFECLELLHAATKGKVNIYQNELVKNIGRYIYRVYINAPYFVNFADAAAKGDIYAGVVYRYGKAIADPLMQGFGAFYAHKQKWGESTPSGTIETVIHDLFDTNEIMAAKTLEPLIGECWLSGTQLALARDKADSKQGFYFAAKGGHNNESHNHNDVGTFILYYNGQPALIDVGVGTYTRQTFSSERYSIWTMQSGYHNLPVINGHDQRFGRKYEARNLSFKSSAKTIDFSVDIAAAYPPEAAVNQWQRSYRLNRGKNFIITDSYNLAENKGSTALHFITSCKATQPSEGVIRLEGKDFVLEMHYDAKKAQATFENIKVEDKRLQGSWGESLTRIQLAITDTAKTASTSIRIIERK